MSPRGGRRDGAGRKPENKELGPARRASLRLPSDLAPDVDAFVAENGVSESKALAAFVRMGVEAHRRKAQGDGVDRDQGDEQPD